MILFILLLVHSVLYLDVHVSYIVLLFWFSSISSQFSSSHHFVLASVHFLIICLSFIFVFICILNILWSIISMIPCDIHGLLFLFGIVFFIAFITAPFHCIQSFSIVRTWLIPLFCAAIFCVSSLSTIFPSFLFEFCLQVCYLTFWSFGLWKFHISIILPCGAQVVTTVTSLESSHSTVVWC